jgi:hypothetical protein
MNKIDRYINRVITKQLLSEAGQSPGEQAKALGLVYGGFGGWIDPDTRVVMARTVDGKLVRVKDGEEEEGDQNLGRLIILNFDPNILHAEKNGIPEEKQKAYKALIHKVLKFGGDFIVFTARTQAIEVAKYLKGMGINNGVKIVPFGSSAGQKKRKFVEKKIKTGYKEIQYFDYNKSDIAAIESLKAPYNKKQIKIDAVRIPELGVVSAATA